ncbi:MAG: DsrE family protein [Nitrospirae bacterium]|nr:DsrE family protein [Nitrospirota bacterium]MBF0534504.1 DsrE family protein [Nitrospirota bacterium]MBF0617130.1 DsrE family protein [Nitrospirota bacterium]
MGLKKILPIVFLTLLGTILVLTATTALPVSYYPPALNNINNPPALGSIRIDIPVKPTEAKVVVNIGNDVMSGDLPLGIKYMTRMVKRFKEKNINWKLSGVFHNTAGYMLLKDGIYNAKRQVLTGNPYKTLIESLIRDGVSIEICALTMEANSYKNEDLIPGVKVVEAAELRIIQLVDEHYVQIIP